MINLGDREIIRGSVNINTECHLLRMLSMFFISLCFMALYENALNQTGFKCGKPTKQTASLLISYGMMITLTSYLGLLLFRKIRGYTRTRVKQRRRLRSGYWTRRRIYCGEEYTENCVYCWSVTGLHQTAHILSVENTKETGGDVYQTLLRYLDEEWAYC